MMSKIWRLTIVAAAGLVLLAGCSRFEQGGKPTYEVTLIQGGKGIDDILIKINVASGAGWYYGRGASSFVAVSDNTAPPTGDYHITYWVTPDGTWNAYRIDSDSGRVWDIDSSTNPPHWVEMKGDTQ